MVLSLLLLASEGSMLQLASVHPPVLALWRRAGLVEALGEGAVFASVEEAVGEPPRVRDPALR